jgi:1-acyl-sn-glycerol-3-phosphate acyltransferase
MEVSVASFTSPKPRRSRELKVRTKDLLRMRIQRFISFVFFTPFCGSFIKALSWPVRIKILNKKQLRAIYKQLIADPRPLLICSNHLTYIDSIIIMAALGSNPWYQTHFRAYPWNLPAAEYARNPIFRFIGFMSKCWFIQRKGSREHQESILGLTKYLLENGEVVTIFPEGRRSRSGYFEFERITNGVGKIISNVPNCRVLCLYVRSNAQTGPSKLPPRGSSFFIESEIIIPASNKAGRNAYSEITQKIGSTIQSLEARYRNRLPHS